MKKQTQTRLVEVNFEQNLDQFQCFKQAFVQSAALDVAEMELLMQMEQAQIATSVLFKLTLVVLL